MSVDYVVENDFRLRIAIRSALFDILVSLHVSEEEPTEFGIRFQKLWQRKYKSQSEFSMVSEINRKYLYILEYKDADPKLSMLERIAEDLVLPVYVVTGYLLGELDFDENDNIIILKK